MASIAPPVVISGPQRRPHPYGLFSVAEFSNPGDQHWPNGLEWEAVSCAPASGIGVDCENVLGPFSFASHSGLAEVTPFIVYGSYTCSPTGRSLDEAADFARAHLATREQYAVERTVSNGLLNNAPNFTTATVLFSGSVTNPSHALGLLEQHIADEYGSLGVIHAPLTAIPSLCRNGMVNRVGSRLETCAGTPVAAGGGYANQSPSGTAAGTAEGWLYATPALYLARSDVDVFTDDGSTLDRATNDLEIVAQRTYAVGWDPCPTAAVLTDLSASIDGGTP